MVPNKERVTQEFEVLGRERVARIHTATRYMHIDSVDELCFGCALSAASGGDRRAGYIEMRAEIGKRLGKTNEENGWYQYSEIERMYECGYAMQLLEWVNEWLEDVQVPKTAREEAVTV